MGAVLRPPIRRTMGCAVWLTEEGSVAPEHLKGVPGPRSNTPVVTILEVPFALSSRQRGHGEPPRTVWHPQLRHPVYASPRPRNAG